MAGSPNDLSKLVAKHMHDWERVRQTAAAQRTVPAFPVEEFITISRMVGARGHDLATELGQRLDWPVFDKEILHAMAGDDAVRAQLYQSLDERDVGWIEDTVRWLVEEEFRKEDYFHRLTETVLAIARQRRVIFLGRGADLMLPRERGQRVWLVASPEYCARRFADRNKVTLALARAEADRITHERVDFRRHHFGKTANDIERYDLVLNMEHFSVAQAVELILGALRSRGAVS